MVPEASTQMDAAGQMVAKRLFRWHLLVFCVVIGVLTLVNVIIGGGWWSFWPLCAWGLALSLHFFYYKSITVDEAWVQERTEDMRLRSYDLGHIHDIEERVEKRDASVRPADERER